MLFDVGHGGGSFSWGVAVPAIQEGFLPDTISTDLHIGSMNTGMKDQLNVMSKFLALGLSLEEVIARSTWNPARAIHREELGHLSVGRAGGRDGAEPAGGPLRPRRLVRREADGRQEARVRDDAARRPVVYDLNGLARPDWKTLPKGYRTTGDPRWDAYRR